MLRRDLEVFFFGTAMMEDSHYRWGGEGRW